MPKNEKWLATALAVTNHCAEILNEQSALVINLKSPTPLSYGFLGVVVTSQF